MDNAILSPARAIGDELFISFARDCQSVVARRHDVQDKIAELTGIYAAEWRMPDTRYMQLQPSEDYASYLLYISPQNDLSIVLDIFMADQAAVTHNHMCWGVFTCLEGVELERLYHVPDNFSGPPKELETRLRPPGVVTLASPAPNAFHQVECAEGDRSVSLHVYGSDIGQIERLVWDEDSGQYRKFTSGYSNGMLGLPAYESN